MQSHRFLGPHREIARELFQSVENLPLVCPHGHVEPALLAQAETRFPDPVDLFLKPDHYLLRMLHSQGIPIGNFLDEKSSPQECWRLFCQNFQLFWGTPSGLWLDYQIKVTFGLDHEISLENADRLYEGLSEKLARAEFRPRALFDRFNIEVLATTDAATDTLEEHLRIQADEWPGRVIPTFRPDKLLWTLGPAWKTELEKLENLEHSVKSLDDFLAALRSRRDFFQTLGCVATDHGCQTPYTEWLSKETAKNLFEKALRQTISSEEAVRLQGHLLIEMAAMSCEDGLVMQLHSGSYRNHNRALFQEYGADKGADIPLSVNFTQELQALLNQFGSHPQFKLLVFTLDESNYSRELAPLAGHYPAMLLGPPWWFHDSLRGMLRYFDQVMETAGVFNTAGFNDDTRAFCSIPARHDLWRRASCRWLSGLVAEGVLSLDQASTLATEMAVGRARSAYKLSS